MTGIDINKICKELDEIRQTRFTRLLVKYDIKPEQVTLCKLFFMQGMEFEKEMSKLF
jgi:hypothetical protein